jgi:hypothetical protein
METSETPTFPSFEDESPCLAQGSLASQRVLPGSDEALAMTVGSGRQLSMLFETSSQLGAFSKILLESSHWTSSEEFSYVWNRLDTRFALSAFQLTPLGQSTEDNGSSLWRTPNASDVTGGPMNGERRLEQGHHLNLLEQAATPKLWPTPTVPNGGRCNPEGTSITGKKPDGGKAQIDIREFAIRMLPTPTARDWKSTSHGNQGNARPLSEVAGLSGSGSLNPRFVEELMGFEIDHTALKRSVTLSSPSKPTRSLRRSPSAKESGLECR